MEETEVINVNIVGTNVDYSEKAKLAVIAGSITLVMGVAGAMLSDSMVARMQRRRALKLAAEKLAVEATTPTES